MEAHRSQEDRFADFINVYIPVIAEQIQHDHEQSLTDLKLKVAGDTYSLYRIFLSFPQKLMQRMLMKSTWIPHGYFKLPVDPKCIQVFPIFLQYLEKQHIKIDIDNVLPLLMLAVEYDSMEIKEMCVDIMKFHFIEAADKGQLIEWFQYVVKLNVQSPECMGYDQSNYYNAIWSDVPLRIKPIWLTFLKNCGNFIKWNLNLCAKIFHKFELNVLIGLLKQPDLIVEDELQLFRYVSSWLSHETLNVYESNNDVSEAVQEIKDLTKFVMSFIKYPMMVPRQIAQLSMYSIVKDNKEFFVEEMALAIQYHTVKTETQSPTDYKFQCTPRIYTSNRWGKSFEFNFQDGQLLYEEIEIDGNLFEREQKRTTTWKVEFKNSLDTLSTGKVIQTVDVKIQPNTENDKGHALLTILVHDSVKECNCIRTVWQNIVALDDHKSYTYSLMCDANESDQDLENGFVSNRHLYKFTIVITPIVPSLTKNICLMNRTIIGC